MERNLAKMIFCLFVGSVQLSSFWEIDLGETSANKRKEKVFLRIFYLDINKGIFNILKSFYISVNYHPVKLSALSAG